MTCSRAIDIHRYHDGELPITARAAIETHLDECAECRGLLRDLQGLSRLVAASTRTAMPGELPDRVSAVWRRRREQGVIRIAGWLTAAAAAVLVVAVLSEPPARNDAAMPNPGIWETVAATPPNELRDETSMELMVMAQWMADELSPRGTR